MSNFKEKLSAYLAQLGAPTKEQSGENYDYINKDGQSVLTLALQKQEYELAAACIVNNAQVTEHVARSLPLMRYAIKNKKEQVVRVMVEKGASLEATYLCKLITKADAMFTVLHIAIWYGWQTVLDACLERSDVNINIYAQNYSVRPIHVAAYQGNLAAMRKLLLKDPKCINRQKGDATPLFYAIYGMQLETVRLILEQPSLTNEWKKESYASTGYLTPMGYAYRYRCLGIMQALIKHGADASDLPNVVVGFLNNFDEKESNLKNLLEYGRLNYLYDELGFDDLCKLASIPLDSKDAEEKAQAWLDAYCLYAQSVACTVQRTQPEKADLIRETIGQYTPSISMITLALLASPKAEATSYLQLFTWRAAGQELPYEWRAIPDKLKANLRLLNEPVTPPIQSCKK